MADPANPFDQFDSDPGRPVIRKGPPQVSPTEVYHPMTPQERQSYGIPDAAPAIINASGKPEIVNTGGGADKISYKQMSHDEKVGAGLDPSLPYYSGSNGLPALPGGAKAAQAPIDPATAREHTFQLLGAIDHANSLLANPLASGLPGSVVGHIPGTDAYTLRSLIGDTNDPGNPGQISGDLRQQGIAYLRALNGGNGVGTVARSQQEQAALQAAMSNLRQGLPKADLQSALGNVRQIYLNGIARSYNLNPDDPNVANILATTPTADLKGKLESLVPAALPPGSNAQAKPGDLGITQSASLPQVTVAPQMGISTGQTKSVLDPKIAAIAPQLEQYLNAPRSKVSDAMIIGFVQKQGIDVSQWPQLQEVLSQRGKARIQVNPYYDVPLHGAEKVGATVTGALPGVTAALAGAADTATLGGIPDAAGIIHGVTGLGPSRSEAVQARTALASAEPGATIAGNIAGGILPLSRAGEASAIARGLKSAGAGATYGFLGSEDPNITSRLLNAGEGAAIGAVAHGATDAAGRLAQSGYRGAARPVESLLFGPEGTADKYALNAAGRKMPLQSLSDVQGADAASKAVGVKAPAVASVNRAGQDYIARAASGSPAARAIADQVAADTRKAIPKELAGDFNSAIEAAAPRGTDTSAYLNRPVREIAGDIQSMAGREFEKGIEPIKGQQLKITPEVISDLDHERVQGAVRDALANHNLSDQTREELRTLIPQLKTVAGAPEFARQQYAKGIPLTVDGARNIATALDRTAGKMMDGTEGQVELSRLSRDIRGAISEQFPEYEPVNARYASRMRAKEAMHSARSGFFASNPDQIDSLAKSSKRYTDTANEGEFNGVGQTPGPALPSNRQLAGTGAREATTVKAGENGTATADRLANNVNQQSNNATVLGQSGAATVQAKAGARANIAGAVDRVTSGGTADKTEGWFNLVKQAVALKATGGSGHYALAHAASSVPGLSSNDAARVVRLYLNADAAPQVLQSLSQAYGARRARYIMARMAAVTAAASGVRGFSKPEDKP